MHDVEGGHKFLPIKTKYWDPVTGEPPEADGSWDTCVVPTTNYQQMLRLLRLAAVGPAPVQVGDRGLDLRAAGQGDRADRRPRADADADLGRAAAHPDRADARPARPDHAPDQPAAGGGADRDDQGGQRCQSPLPAGAVARSRRPTCTTSPATSRSRSGRTRTRPSRTTSSAGCTSRRARSSSPASVSAVGWATVVEQDDLNIARMIEHHLRRPCSRHERKVHDMADIPWDELMDAAGDSDFAPIPQSDYDVKITEHGGDQVQHGQADVEDHVPRSRAARTRGASSGPSRR